MRKRIASIVLFLVISFGIAIAYTQSGTALITASNLYTALTDNTLVPTGANGCTASGNVVPSASYIKTCVKNNGNCFSGANSYYVPTYNAILACKATPGPTATPVPTATPTPAPTATPLPHTTGLAITDGCITSSSNYSQVSGTTVTPAYQALTSGSSCSSGNELYNGAIKQALNHGANINAGTIVKVGADLYNATDTETDGSADCLSDTETATGTAQVELLNSAGTVIGSHAQTASGGWSYLTYTATIPSTGVYYIAVVSTSGSATLNYQTSYYKTPKGGEPIEECNSTTSKTISAYGYSTYLTVTSS